MAAGLPIVASRVGGLVDVIAHGVTGVLVTPQNPEALASGIRQVLSSSGSAATMGEAARLRAQQFSLETMLEQLDALYARVVA